MEAVIVGLVIGGAVAWFLALRLSRLKPDKPSKSEIIAYIKLCIERRHEWAKSPDGYRRLGPGSPTVPGLEEYGQILAFIEGRSWPDR